MNWRDFARIETALVVAALILLVVFVTSGQRGSVLSTEIEELEGRVTRERLSLASLEESSDFAALETELERLQSLPEPQALPSREGVLTLEATLFAKAEEVGALMSSFVSRDGVVPLGGREFEAVSFTAQALGSAESLTSLLQLLEVYESAVVRQLDFGRNGGLWEMSLGLDVIYGVIEPEPEPEE